MDSNFFYQNDRVASVVLRGSIRSWLRNEGAPLASVSHGNGRTACEIYAVDFASSVVGHSRNYTPYGYLHVQDAGARPQLLYVGQRLDALSELYFLGNGRRAFCSRQGRFFSADSYSPFGLGGINAYMYCGGDPVNRSDPSGRVGRRLFNFLRGRGWIKNDKSVELNDLKRAVESYGEERVKVDAYIESHYGDYWANELKYQRGRDGGDIASLSPNPKPRPRFSSYETSNSNSDSNENLKLAARRQVALFGDYRRKGVSSGVLVASRELQGNRRNFYELAHHIDAGYMDATWRGGELSLESKVKIVRKQSYP